MSSIGPELPPHLAKKRKRDDPARPDELLFADQSAAKTDLIPSPSNESDTPRQVYGPALPSSHSPHAPSLPSETNGSDSSDGEESYGPNLPTKPSSDIVDQIDTGNRDTSDPILSKEVKPTRDEWMIVPPKQDDLAARMDPTRARPRKFNTGRGARIQDPGSLADAMIWTETPEQKRTRLQNEQLGISEAPSERDQTTENWTQKARRDEEKARRIREHNDKYRSTSLLSQHETSGPTEKEDDPNHRSFDYEKDMAANATLGHVKKRELLKQATQFTSKFSRGNYL